MKKLLVWLLALALTVMFVPAMAEETDEAEGTTLIFSTMAEGTGAYDYAVALKDIMEDALPEGWSIELTTDSPGAVDAPALIEEGGADFVMSNAGPALWYSEDHPGTKVRAMFGGLGYDFMNVMITEAFSTENNVISVEEIVSKQLPVRLAVKSSGSLGAMAAEKLMEALGVTYDDIRSWGGEVIETDSAGIREAIENGEADMTIDHISAWQGNTTALCENVPMVFPQLETETLDKLVEMGFGLIDIEPGMFVGLTNGIATVGSQQVVLTSADLDTEVARALTQAVCEHAADLEALSAALERFVPTYAGAASLCGARVHPGAAEYYWTMGYPSKVEE